MSQHKKSITVPMNVADLFEIWLDLENIHEFWPYVKSVEPMSRHKSYWTMMAPDGTLLYWDEKITLLEEDSRIAWRSTGGDVLCSGLVTLEKLDEDETEVSLTLHFEPDPSLGEDKAAELFENVDGLVELILQNYSAYALKDWDQIQ
ncbi:MAG: hypothetical protein JSW55_02475 [Chloroflexota bacterium]|nr:MAG: hypothetical protein JSW55_02475 [Chloroflexota bacterium]